MQTEIQTYLKPYDKNQMPLLLQELSEAAPSPLANPMPEDEMPAQKNMRPLKLCFFI